MEIKKIILFCLLIILNVSYIDLIYAENVEISDKGVKFDKEVLDNFNLISVEKDSFLNGSIEEIA